MLRRFSIGLLAVVAFGFASQVSAALVYDIYTSSSAGDDLLTGTIGFENLDGAYQGSVTAADVTLFTWDGTVLGSLFAPDPDDWNLSTVSGDIDVPSSSLLLTQLWAAPSFPTAGGLDINNAGTSQTGGFGYVLGLFQIAGDAYLQARQTPVPEPSVMMLLGIGLAGIGFARRGRAWSKAHDCCGLSG